MLIIIESLLSRYGRWWGKNTTYRRLWIIGVKINSRLDDLLELGSLFLRSLVLDELTALLFNFSTLDNPSLLWILYFFFTKGMRYWYKEWMCLYIYHMKEFLLFFSTLECSSYYMEWEKKRKKNESVMWVKHISFSWSY